jgi:hypothetical protein
MRDALRPVSGLLAPPAGISGVVALVETSETEQLGLRRPRTP